MIELHLCVCFRNDDHADVQKERFAGQVPTLRVLRSSEYHRVLQRGFRSNSLLFDESVCLLPETMTVLAPQVLSFAGCVAIMYAFDVFGRLSVEDSERAGSAVQLSVTAPLSLSYYL